MVRPLQVAVVVEVASGGDGVVTLEEEVGVVIVVAEGETVVVEAMGVGVEEVTSSVLVALLYLLSLRLCITSYYFSNQENFRRTLSSLHISRPIRRVLVKAEVGLLQSSLALHLLDYFLCYSSD